MDTKLPTKFTKINFNFSKLWFNILNKQHYFYLLYITPSNLTDTELIYKKFIYILRHIEFPQSTFRIFIIYRRLVIGVKMSGFIHYHDTRSRKCWMKKINLENLYRIIVEYRIWTNKQKNTWKCQFDLNLLLSL